MPSMKRLLTLLLIGLVGCTLPPGYGFTPATLPTSAPTLDLSRPTSMPTPRGQLGTAQNPLVLALPPSAQPQPAILQAGQVLTSLLEKETPYRFVAVISPSETELINAFGNGNAHLGVLSPFGYLLASDQGYAEAAFAREQEGAIFYGAELISRSDAGYTVYYDPIQAKNLAEAPVALAQFKDKKPCWADALSPSGYVVPLGSLGEAGVATRQPAFLASHPSVVRALYAGGICDFGATYVDARAYPGLEDELPNVMKKILVVWAVPPIIPYETLVYANGMAEDMRRALSRAFIDLMSGADGQSAMQTLYGFGSMQVVQDSQYADFREAVKASGLALSGLIK